MDLVNEPSSLQGNECEVFLSFVRGENTQESFASRLYSSLREARIAVLKDNAPLELLLSTIEGSEISIIILSEHYASSIKCLKELTKIMEFRKAHDQIVVPVFYGVLPYEVRNQESSFGEAFQDLVQKISPPEDEVSRWRVALTEVGAILGFDVPNLESNNESADIQEYIQNIVKSVHYILNARGPIATDGLVGVSSQVQEVITMLHRRHRRDVDYIVICGMGGSGKTTLLRLIFNLVHYDFESTCFLSNVSEFRGKKVPKLINLKSMKELDWKTKVLLVIENVSRGDIDLYGRRKLFGKGSRIIITARGLRPLMDVDNLYRMKLLSDEESLELLSRNIFKEGSPDQGESMELLRDEKSLAHLSRRNTFKEASPGGEFMELCRRMVAYAEGLPLALKVIGSVMRGISPVEWESAWMKLSTVLDSRIYNSLKPSYDTLNGDEKELFLNIILFYIGEDVHVVNLELARRSTASPVMLALVNRSLLTIDSNNKVRMHSLLQLMGRQIMRESSQNELLNRDHKYEVFLSFRGEDTRTTFTSHLYSALCNAGIVVFKDDVDIPRGNHIKMELLRAIGSSKIAIIILSKEYAGSKWCLEELSIIMELHKSNDQVVLPVFYNVDPSEIRNQICSFGEAFDNLIQRFSPPENQVSNWRAALVEAGGIAGIVVLGFRDESEDVKKVVENVCDILDKKDLFVADHPIGVDDRVEEVIAILQNHQPDDVVMVGIWGMGGIGKTTIAKSIYNGIGHKFESRSYLPKIRKTWNKKKGQVSLQNQLLSEICKTTKMKINSVESGKITLKDRLQNKKALVVLDDVDKLAQLNALVGSRDWFKPGSTIIITTRNQRLLLQKECSVYRMKNLDEKESIKLFCWHAFKQESPKKGFAKLSRDIVAYSGGLPLALEVLGSYLFDREAKEWKRVLEKLKRIPHDKIQKKLKISFDGLDALEKEIFLDISCFFIGMDRNDVTQILNACEFFADIGIKTLVERSLVTVGEKNTLGMHDLLRDMGRELVRDYSQSELGKRSRIWFHENALTVLSEHMGTEAIEGLSLKLSQSQKMQFHTEAFKKMKRLRLLRLHNVQLRGNYKNISKNLKWLCWHDFAVKYIPRKFCQEELVAIDLKYNSLLQVWREPPVLVRLKILNLSHSPYLVQTPDFSNLPNLETLVLKDCPSLSKIHHSIGLLHKLLLLDLEDCIGLQSLPRSIYRLKCLKTLILSGCVKIAKLEEDIEQMESLTTLIAPALKKVPFSLVKLKSILYLSVCGHKGLSHHVIPSLCRSWISPTDNPLPFIPTHADMASTIFCDPLNSIHHPSTVSSGEPKQQCLLLQDGSEIPNSVCATNCMDISLENCFEHLLIQIGKNSQVFRTLSERISQRLMNIIKHSDDCVLPGDNYPYWLTFKGEGSSVQFEVPQVNGRNHLKGMVVCCVYFPSSDLGNKACEFCISCLMIMNYTRKTTLFYMEDNLKSMEEAERKKIVSNLEPDDQVEVKAIFGNGFTVKKTAIYLIYKDSFEQPEPSTSQTTNLGGTKRKCGEEEEHQPMKLKKAMKI